MDKKQITLRDPFPPNQISKLPKPTKHQTDAAKSGAGIRCTLCGGWHHPDVIHLDYVGHAALTDRLLDVDPNWAWEPLAYGADGLPAIDRDGGLWIRLTVNGITRLGYGDAQGKGGGGDAMKERIGDALRNAAMRFGAALDLWHKGYLHATQEVPICIVVTPPVPSAYNQDTGDSRPPDFTVGEIAPPEIVKEYFSGVKAFKDKFGIELAKRGPDYVYAPLGSYKG